MKSIGLWCLCIPAAAILALTAGCQQRIDQQDVFKEQVDRIDRSAKDIDALRRELSVMNTDLQNVSLDVADIKKNGAAAGGGGGEAAAALEQRLIRMEQTIKNYDTAFRTLNDRLVKVEGQPARPAAAAPAPSQATSAPQARPAPAVRPKPEPEPARATGVYHEVKTGETLEAIAGNYGVTAAAIRAANRLPATAEVLPGQRLFVPGAK